MHHEFGHDTGLRPTQVTNSQVFSWSWAHDAAGRLVTETDFDDRSLTCRHDAAVRLVARTNTLGETTVRERDALGQIVCKDAAGQVTTYAYDVSGRLAEATGPDGTRPAVAAAAVVECLRESCGIDGVGIGLTFDRERNRYQFPWGGASAEPDQGRCVTSAARCEWARAH